MAERAHPDTRPAVWGASSHGGAVDQGDVAIIELLGVDRSHGAVWNWVHTLSEAQSDPPAASPSRVTVNEKQIEVDDEKSGSTLRSTQIQSYCSKSTCPAAAGPTPRQRFSIASPRDIRDEDTDNYHLYMTDLPREKFLPSELATIYRCRWEVELLFRELKTQYELDEFDTRKTYIVEILLYAALLSLLVSCDLLVGGIKREELKLAK